MTALHRTSEWMALTRRIRPRLQQQIDAGGLPCVQPRCQKGGIVQPGQRWHVAHIIDAAKAPALALDPTNLGAAHAKCNTSDGGRAGAELTNRKRARAAGRQPKGERFIAW